MSIDAVQALGIHDEVPPSGAVSPKESAAIGMPFGELFTESVEALNRQLLTSQRDLQQMAVGEAGNLHEVLIRLEESRTALQLFLQVRNRALEAYQDIMRMQV